MTKVLGGCWGTGGDSGLSQQLRARGVPTRKRHRDAQKLPPIKGGAKLTPWLHSSLNPEPGTATRGPAAQPGTSWCPQICPQICLLFPRAAPAAAQLLSQISREIKGEKNSKEIKKTRGLPLKTHSVPSRCLPSVWRMVLGCFGEVRLCPKNL